MTIKRGESRDIDNRKLRSLTSGETFVPALGKHVAWEGYGERAASIVLARHPGLRDIVSQPKALQVSVNGERRKYTGDFELSLEPQPNLVVELKGDRDLKKDAVLEKLRAADFEIGKSGRRFAVINGTRLCRSIELRNTQLLRRYASVDVPAQLLDVLLGVFRSMSSVPLGDLVEGLKEQCIERPHIYALIYQGFLDFDWSLLLDDDSLVSRGERSKFSLPGNAPLHREPR